MIATLSTDVESLSRRLTNGLQDALEAAIKDKLMTQADVIVSNLAREMAQNLKGNVHMWRDIAGDSVQVTLVLDGIKELVK